MDRLLFPSWYKKHHILMIISMVFALNRIADVNQLCRFRECRSGKGLKCINQKEYARRGRCRKMCKSDKDCDSLPKGEDVIYTYACEPKYGTCIILSVKLTQFVILVSKVVVKSNSNGTSQSLINEFQFLTLVYYLNKYGSMLCTLLV